MISSSLYIPLKEREDRLRFWYEHGADLLWLNDRGEGIGEYLHECISRLGAKDDLIQLLQELIEDAKRKGGSVHK